MNVAAQRSGLSHSIISLVERDFPHPHNSWVPCCMDFSLAAVLVDGFQRQRDFDQFLFAGHDLG